MVTMVTRKCPWRDHGIGFRASVFGPFLIPNLPIIHDDHVVHFVRSLSQRTVDPALNTLLQ